VAGTGTPVIDMGAAVGATNVSIRRWSGGLTFNNIAAGDVISVDTVSGGTITLNGADGNVQVRGMVNVVDNRTGTPTLGTTNNMDARFDAVDTLLTTIAGYTDDIGVAGAGLTALGDTRIANLDATVSSRSTLTQTQVSGGAYALNSASFLFDAAAKNAIADSVLLRNVSNVEATAGEHTICTIVLGMLENSTVASPGNLVIYRTDGVTVHATKPITTDAAAEPLTGIS
jgi:hypothetical protein